ncbi:MAG: IS3 family transposase, partial [Bacteroides sp.]
IAPQYAPAPRRRVSLRRWAARYDAAVLRLGATDGEVSTPVAERVNILYAEKFNSPEEFVKALEEYIVYYNNKRIKSRLKGKSPVQYRTLSQSN